MVVKKSIIPDKVILVHKGGLGDFLQAWPTLHALRCTWPDSEFLWAGKESRRFWLDPLRIGPCPPKLRQALDSLYWADRFPEILTRFEIFWFGLERSQLSVNDRRIHFLQGIPSDRNVPPRDAYATTAESYGIRISSPWRQDFQSWFRKEAIEDLSRVVLIFPGSGHLMKCWPMVQFFQLARWLHDHGLSLRFVLGPAEIERGVSGDGFPTIRPESLPELQETLTNSGFVIGNDSGPMHLAGMLGIPGLALFGPTSSTRWAPEGLTVITGYCSQRPCTLTAGIECTDNMCMHSITQEKIREVLRQVVLPKGNRLIPDRPE
jgi:ADP-heptose:LPS heptosyltransferase